jgi:hypothetical protein
MSSGKQGTTLWQRRVPEAVVAQRERREREQLRGVTGTPNQVVLRGLRRIMPRASDVTIQRNEMFMRNLAGLATGYLSTGVVQRTWTRLGGLTRRMG